MQSEILPEHIEIEEEAKQVAHFFNTLLMEKVPENVAKALAVAYVQSFERKWSHG